jgi:hypothetical protein
MSPKAASTDAFALFCFVVVNYSFFNEKTEKAHSEIDT